MLLERKIIWTIFEHNVEMELFQRSVTAGNDEKSAFYTENVEMEFSTGGKTTYGFAWILSVRNTRVSPDI